MTYPARYSLALLVLLALSACDSSTSDPNTTARLSTSAFVVEVPDVLRFGEVVPLTVTITNPTRSNLYLGRPNLELFRESDTPYSTGAQSAATLSLIYSPYTPAILRENELIRPGESRTLGLSLDLRPDGLALWEGEGPVNGSYRVGATLFTTPGDENSLYRGAPAPTDISFSAPFDLTFEGR